MVLPKWGNHHPLQTLPSSVSFLGCGSGVSSLCSLGPYCRSYLLRGDVRLTRALWEIIDLLSLEIADSTERRTQMFRFGIHFLSPIFHYVFPMTDGPVPGPELLRVSRLHYAVHKNPY